MSTFFATFLLAAAQAFAVESFEARHARDFGANPPDLHFRLSTPGTAAFRPGERIPIVLSFWSDTPAKYKLDAATYDRSGRLPSEQFILEREVEDPYRDYYGAGVLGGLAGGIRGIPVLDANPVTVLLDLNDWFRFERPGRYRLYLKSHRLTREIPPDRDGRRTEHFAAVSNILEIEIAERDPAWEAAALAGIRDVLGKPAPERPKPGGPPVPVDPFEDQRREAWRQLRYLATTEAVELAFALAGTSGDVPDARLLASARDRGRMLTLYDQYLADPQVAISEWAIRLRAFFTYLAQDAPTPLPTFSWQFEPQQTWESVSAIARQRQPRSEALVRAEAVRLIAGVAAKSPGARKASVAAIAELAPEAARAAGILPPYDYGLSRVELIAQFAGFDPERQGELLGPKWDLIRGPDAVPALRAIIDKAPPKPLPHYGMGLHVWGTGSSLAEDALRRLAEVAPAEVERILRADLAGGAPRFPGYAVREFPAGDIPEADAALAALLKEHGDAALPLVARFGSAGLAGPLRQRIMGGRPQPCDPEADVVAFFLRTHPGDKPGEGGDVLRRALAARAHRGCHHFLFNRIAGVVWNATLEKHAIAALDDPDPETAADAARTLARHGGPSVEAALWKRLERWSEQWRARAKELETNPITGELPNWQDRLGETLFASLATARSWLLDASRRRRLRALCVDGRCREAWREEAAPGPERLEVTSGGSFYPARYRVGGFDAGSLDELKQRLRLYPEGAAFRWCSQNSPFEHFTAGQQEGFYQDLVRSTAARRQTIEPLSPEKCGTGLPR